MLWDSETSFEGLQKKIEAGMKERISNYAILRSVPNSH